MIQKTLNNLPIILLSMAPFFSYADDSDDGVATGQPAATGGVSGAVQPEEKEAKSRIQNNINDDDNYLGDRLSFPIDISGKYLDSETGKEAKESVCIPAETTLRGLGKVDSENKLVVRVGQLFSGPVDCDDGKPLKKTKAIRVSVNPDIGQVPNRYGLTYGALVVPYKYHFSGSKNFKANSTVAPYLGYRVDKNYTYGFGYKFIGFVGGTMIEVSRTEGEETKNESLAGFSYGVGLIGDIKDEFQFGLVFGQDKVGGDSDYEDNGKWWGAVALGYSFSN